MGFVNQAGLGGRNETKGGGDKTGREIAGAAVRVSAGRRTDRLMVKREELRRRDPRVLRVDSVYCGPSHEMS